MHTTIDGVNAQYEIAGEGAPVLVLHGWGASIEVMRGVINAVVNMGMQAVALDFPGFGGSHEPLEPWGVAEYAAFTRKFMEQEGIVGADVVSHSFGGRVAILLASEDKTLFNRLVLMGAAGIRPKRTLKWYVRTYLYKLGKRLSQISVFDRLFHLKEKQKSAGSEDYKALKTDLMRKTFVKVVNLDLSDRLEKIENSTLLIWGTEDTNTPLYMGKIMEKKIPDAGLVEFQGAGHYSFAEQYGKFCAVLRAFLCGD
ncbi:alpha/beta hydrolase [Christensenellaceae bacterium OttesenSCG-928-M15]|nr:alpha/beta hydrolase [Christensenellaceae bacterium OttesenSCG-928-M15]